MNVPIISRDITGLFRALLNMGFRNMHSIVWVRSPARINGVWHAKVKV